jgi:uncharacterized protein YfaS (alpha-2-macroglobulin family)
MSRLWLLFLVCLATAAILFAASSRAGNLVSVNEAATRFVLERDSASVQLTLVNPSAEKVSARIQLELLDPNSSVRAAISAIENFDSGTKTVRLTLPFNVSKLTPPERRKLLWYRLRYQISDAVDRTPGAHGLMSLSQITSDLFEVRLTTSEIVREGAGYFARIQAVHPVTRQGVAHIAINAEVTLADGAHSVKLNAAGETDSKGYVTLNFRLPSRFPSYPHEPDPAGGEIHVVASGNGLRSEITADVMVDQFARLLISTDKPLYQPGQTLHTRILAFTPSKHALVNQNVRIRIKDPENTLVFQTVIKSSRFGIANADWPIPDNMRLGDYRIWAGIDGGDESSDTICAVRISRYDLPNFSVTVDPDRKYYLAKENAVVKVRADYLFGQPVKRGHVRVVRESGREWNYAEQKWDIDEGETYEGETDSGGAFTARINLEDEHEKLSDNDYSRFRDISYAAYFTDPTTNRTEQKRFDLRVTRQAIHIYLIDQNSDDSRNPKLPLKFYVSTFYADGSPARCTVQLNLAPTDHNSGKTEPKHGFAPATIRTNRYGLGKVAGLHISRDLTEEDELQLLVRARDAKGQEGAQKQEFYIHDVAEVLIDTDRTLYKPGEPITATVTSTVHDLKVMVDVVSNQSVIRSEKLQLHDGRGTITLPYQTEFSDVLTIAAYQDFASSLNMVATRSILYPRDRALKVSVGSLAASYRPGEEANVDLKIRNPEGRGTEGALGVVVLDRAVELRARTDLEFGRRVSDFNQTLADFIGLNEQVAGVSLHYLRQLDTSAPISLDLDLVAEVLLNQGDNYRPQFHEDEQFDRDQSGVFAELIRASTSSSQQALTDRYAKTQEYAQDESQLRKYLKEAGIDFAAIVDPWGLPFRPVFSVERQSDVLTLISAGANKRFGDDDDFAVNRLGWLYFRPVGEAIDRAVRNYHQRTGAYIRDRQTLRNELISQGIDLVSLVDRWNRPYRFDFSINKSNFVVTVSSGGPNQQFDTGYYSGDDFVIWTSAIDYFAELRTRLDEVFSRELSSSGTFPLNEKELEQSLRAGHFDVASLRDPWNHPYYAIFKTQSFSTDQMKIESHGKSAELLTQQLQLTPVTQKVASIFLRSAGPDGKASTFDDFEVAMFARVLSVQSGAEITPQLITAPVLVSAYTGAITGTVTDPNGGRISGARVTAKDSSSARTYETLSNDEGAYSFANLPSGIYEVRFQASGFSLAIVTDVLVRSLNVVEVNVTLQLGSTAETVTVTAAAPGLQTEAAQASMLNAVTVRRAGVKVVTKSGGPQISTPRLREYFPETLVWQPSLETDRQGRAHFKFKLADNITTWKMLVVGSTENGQIATAEKEIKSFQPFFVEHDPPRILTEGDEITLPVVVRNYLERAQTVNLEIKPEDWFTLLGSATRSLNVAAGDAARGTFDFRARASIKDGKQRITALGADENDAIEKPISVHPNGEEQSITAAEVVNKSAVSLEIPAAVIPNSTRGELKIYPHLTAHVAESVEAIMERPHGCGEQTISSTYPSLLWLRYSKSGETPLRARAERYLRAGYQRLLNYRDSSGGFTYWGHGDPDVALTAYALRFLSEARGIIQVDDDVITGARNWLIHKQRSDGSWPASDYGNQVEINRRTALLSAYVARVLTLTGGEKGSPELKKVLDYLKRRSAEIEEPYLLASLALAANAAGDAEDANTAVTKLRALAHEENGANYWSLETNTPFYGWGLAGRVETSALVLQALTKTRGSGTPDSMISRGLLFLLRSKDRYGVWYSTQATINVLDAMLSLLTSDTNGAPTSAAKILVNGKSVSSVNLPNDNLSSAPISVDITQALQPGTNRIEVQVTGNPDASLQASATYYLPWSESKAGKAVSQRPSGSGGLRLVAQFDKTEAAVGTPINCHVEAERIGFSGYGMLLAEIGLPPGADVDRASLDAAIKKSGWVLTQYDILPDRLIVYLWPYAGATKFDFTFRPRFGLKAQSAPSVIYDYYNPEARAVVKPVKFVVR